MTAHPNTGQLTRHPAGQRAEIRSSLGACFAFLVAFIGLVHEVYGATVFPWLPPYLGLVPFHLIGAFLIVAGAAMLADAWGLLSAPVTALAATTAILGVISLTVIGLHGQFHFFGLWLTIAGLSIPLMRR